MGYPPAPPSAPLAAPAAAHKPFTKVPPKLPPQTTSTPIPAPFRARSYPPSPSVETIEEVEDKQIYKSLQNIKQMRQNQEVSKTVSKICVAEFLEN